MKHLEPCIMCGKSKAHVVYSGLKVRGVIPLFFGECVACHHQGPYLATPEFAADAWNAEWHDNQHGQMDEGDET